MTHPKHTAAPPAAPMLVRALEASDDAVIVRDAAGVVTFANVAAETLLGRPALGLGADEAFALTTLDDGRGNALTPGKLFEPCAGRDVRALTLRGERWLRARCLAGDAGERMAILRDETDLRGERARADARERSLSDSESAAETRRRDAERLRVLAEASRAFAEAGLDPRAAFQSVVRYVADVTGDGCVLCLLSDDGTRLETVAHHHSVPRVRELLGALFARDFRVDEGLPGMVARSGRSLLIPRFDTRGVPGTARRETHEYFTQVAPHSILMVPLRGRERVIGTLAVSRDRVDGAPYNDDDQRLLEEIADRAALVLENARLFEAAQNAIRVRDDFLSIAAHELRTPLTALQLHVQSAARVALRESAPPAIVHTLEAADRQVIRLVRLAENLLDVSRITLGRLELHRERVDLSALVGEVAERHRGEAERAGSAITLSLAPDAAGHWDRVRVEQATTNLLANAIKYGNARPISVSTERDAGLCRLVVRDQGIGVPLEMQGRIFQRFERAVSSRSYGGLGLGLFITRQIVEAHGGSVRVESVPGDGATFVMELPAEAPGSLGA